MDMESKQYSNPDYKHQLYIVYYFNFFVIQQIRYFSHKFLKDQFSLPQELFRKQNNSFKIIEGKKIEQVYSKNESCKMF